MALSWWLGVFHYGDSCAGSMPGTLQGVVWAQTFLWHPWLWGETGHTGADLGLGALSGLLLSTAPAMLAPLQSHIRAVLQSKVKDLLPEPAGWGVAASEEGGRRHGGERVVSAPPGVPPLSLEGRRGGGADGPVQ